MEDPWANAWGKSEDAMPHAGPSTWETAPRRGLEDSEADIAGPAWEPSTSPVIRWQDDPAPVWPSRALTPELPGWGQDRITPSPEPTPPSSPSLPSPEEPPERRESSPESPPQSPDAFGTFATGGTDDIEIDGADPWTPSPAGTSGATWDEPDTAWVTEASPRAHARDQPDEWEAAHELKAKRDRQVPPELLKSIQGDFTSLANELWPAPSTEPAQSNLCTGMDGLQDTMPAAEKILSSEIAFPPLLPFPKTSTAKHMSDSLRLTRHSALTRNGPMAHYMASKGSTAWEASVKARPEIALEDDLLPAGWKLVKETPEAPVVVPEKKGGLLSFWGRKPSAESSAVSPSTRVSISGDSIRSSVDSVRSPTTPATPPAVTAVPSAPTAFPEPVRVSTPILAPPPAEEEENTAEAPSAVSRFLTRFSRNKSAVGPSITTRSPRGSMALSTNDLEFLSDLVPSAAEEHHADGGLDALSSMIGSSPAPKLPAPLAPPPRAPLPPPRPATLHPTKPSLFVPVAQAVADSDLEAFFSPVSPVSPMSVLSNSQNGLQMSPTADAATISAADEDAWFSEEMAPKKPTAKPFGFPAPPVQRTQSPSTVLSPEVHATKLPPRAAMVPTISPPAPRPVPVPTHSLLAKTIDEDDGDDFSDFHSPQAAYDSTFSSFPSDQQFFAGTPNSASAMGCADSSFGTSSLLGGIKTTPTSSFGAFGSFDDFDNFTSSPLRSPSPPKPPPKVIMPMKKPAIGLKKNIPIPSSAGIPTLLPPPKSNVPAAAATSRAAPLPTLTLERNPPSRVAEHARARSLVEKAAEHQGRWPAPESPLPEILARPPAGVTDFFGGEDLMMGGGGSGGSSMSRQQNQAVAQMKSAMAGVGLGISASASSPASIGKGQTSLLPPPSFSSARRSTSMDEDDDDDVPLGSLAPSPARTRVTSPPPPPKSTSDGLRNDFFFAPPPGASASRSQSPPAFNPPLSRSGTPASPPKFQAFAPPPASFVTSRSTTPAVQKVATPTGGGKGGLSAQDLSFFEGL